MTHARPLHTPAFQKILKRARDIIDSDAYRMRGTECYDAQGRQSHAILDEAVAFTAHAAFYRACVEALPDNARDPLHARVWHERVYARLRIAWPHTGSARGIESMTRKRVLARIDEHLVRD